MGIGIWLRRSAAFMLAMMGSAISASLSGSVIIYIMLRATGTKFNGWEDLGAIAVVSLFGLVFSLPIAIVGMGVMCTLQARTHIIAKQWAWVVVGAVCAIPLGILMAFRGEGEWRVLIIFLISGAMGGAAGGKVWCWLWNKLKCGAPLARTPNSSPLPTLDSAPDDVAQDPS